MTLSGEQHADALVETRRAWAYVGAALGGFYAQLKLNGMPDSEASYFTGSLFDRLVEREMAPKVSYIEHDVKIHKHE